MSTRVGLRHQTNTAAPNGSNIQPGDEWYNPTTNVLSKWILGGGTIGYWSPVSGFLNTTITTTGTYPAMVLSGTTTANSLDLVLAPKGGGAFQLQAADGALTGGNKRGIYAIDLQRTRSAADQIAAPAWSGILSGAYNKIAAGAGTPTSGSYSVIAGGNGNIITGSQALSTNAYDSNFIGGGNANTITSSYYSAIAGGSSNSCTGLYAFIGGGSGNQVTSTFSTVAGGSGNNANLYDFVGGGTNNSAVGTYATVAGGTANFNGGYYTSILGGYTSTITAYTLGSSILGGYRNVIWGANSSISGGTNNTIGTGSLSGTSSAATTLGGVAFTNSGASAATLTTMTDNGSLSGATMFLAGNSTIIKPGSYPFYTTSNTFPAVKFYLDAGGPYTTTSCTISGTTATITFTGQSVKYPIGATVTIAGTATATANTYNGNFTVVTSTVGQITCVISTGTPTGPATTQGTVSHLTQFHPMTSTISTASFVNGNQCFIGSGTNTITGNYSAIGTGGNFYYSAGRNTIAGDWSFIGSGMANTIASTAVGSFIGGGGVYNSSIPYTYIGTGDFSGNTIASVNSFIGSGAGNNITSTAHLSAILGGTFNTADGFNSAVLSGSYGTTRGVAGRVVNGAVGSTVVGGAQSSSLIYTSITLNATPSVLLSNGAVGDATNQLTLPNNSAMYFKGSVIATVSGGGDTKAWVIEGAIKRGITAGSTALVGTPTVTSGFADAGASAWAVAVTADTTNGALTVTVTGAAATTIKWVCKLESTEVSF